MKPLRFEKLTVEKAVAEGHCLAYAGGKTIFVSHAAPGDVADIRIIKKQKGSLFGKIENLHVPGPDRVEPRCEHSGICGGCKWQQVSYEAQKKHKQQQVKESFERIGHLDFPEILPLRGSSQIFEYRNRLDFGFSHQRFLLPEEMNTDERPQLPGVGFHVPGRFDKVLDIRKCHLQEDLCNSIRLAAKDFALANAMDFYDLKNHTGLMRSLIIRNSTLGEWMVIVAFAYADEKNSALLAHLSERFPQITSLMYVINPKKNETIYDLDIHCFKGKDHLLEKLGSCTFKIGPKSFFQTNSRQAATLYEITKNFAGLTGKELVYDLYTGTGSIALYLADKAEKVVGVEYVEQAIDDARENAALNHIQHVKFFAGDMKEVLNHEFIAREGRPDVIITDPPRAGMHEDVVRTIAGIRAKRIVYVSCNPATQARDLALLKDLYRIEKVQPVDMFPHTHHVENVVLLTLKS
jgi:23S rRNA (uracil1939-C5)-methyltransferase